MAATTWARAERCGCPGPSPSRSPCPRRPPWTRLLLRPARRDRQRLPSTRSGASQEKRATSPESGGGHSDAGIGSSFAGQQSSTGQVSWTRRRGRTPPRTCGVCRFRAAAAVASVVPRTRGRRAAVHGSTAAASASAALKPIQKLLGLILITALAAFFTSGAASIAFSIRVSRGSHRVNR